VDGLRGVLNVSRSERGKEDVPAEESRQKYKPGTKSVVWRRSQMLKTAESQGNGQERRKDGRLIPETGICTGNAAVVDNYTVN